MKLTSIRPLPCTSTWTLLLVLTLASLRLGASGSGPALVMAVLALTLIKGQLIADYFMGLRRVRSLWRAAMFAYLLVVGGLIATAYLIA